MASTVSKTCAVALCLMMAVSAIPIGLAASAESQGFDGVSWKPVVPIRKATLVNFDANSYLDDYAYLAAIPSSVFYDAASDKIYSNPLIFYEPPFNDTDPTKQTLNTNKGIGYFMDDWQAYCGNLDTLELIGMDSIAESSRWPANETVSIIADSPYEMAKKIALDGWMGADSAVVAAIDETFDQIDEKTSGRMTGVVPGSMKATTMQIKNTKSVGIPPQFNNFTIPDGYKFIIADASWDLVPNVLPSAVEPPFWGIDPDMQLYDWTANQMVGSSVNWMVPNEHIESYIYHPGPWAIAMTYMPTKSTEPPLLRTAASAKDGLLTLPSVLTDAVYTVDITMHPGVEFNLTDACPFYCRDATFKLTWSDPNAMLGLVVRDEGGAEIAFATAQLSTQEISIPQLGEGTYSATVIKLNDASSDVDFTLEYSWSQKKEKKEEQMLSSAAQGAVLASLLNAPLLYTSPDELSDGASSAIKALGVEKIYLVNIGGLASSKVKSRLKSLGSVMEYSDYSGIYSKIHGMTGDSTIVFSTIDPWSYWYSPELVAAGEMTAGLFVGPAAYMAAHHGCPVFIVESDGRLSQSVAWHNEDWRKKAPTRDFPSVACMTLTGKQVYDFVGEYGFDGDGMETMITVADQYDIGVPWDRVFPGVAKPGRIMGAPADAAYWISRSVFYPAMVFANPATSPYGVDRITGSSSVIDVASGELSITQGGEVNVMYPILETWVSYDHRFNERASSYWGLDYTTAQGITPFRTPSTNPIDDGVCADYGVEGMMWPDLTESEVCSFYAEKAGYTPVYSTAFDPVMENLNRGVLLWDEVMHGGQSDAGNVGFWYDDVQPEKNPWRCYEEGGSTYEPDSMCMSNMFAFDVVPSGPVTGYDGVVITVISQLTQTSSRNGYDFDTAMQNMHSAGFMGGSCLISNTWMHLTMVRHGFLYQVIDPWVTSWYCAFAFQTINRDIALGKDMGEAYVNGILNTGIGYMVGSWWWDISENVEYFGDPDIKMFTPYAGWDRPESIGSAAMVAGHVPAGIPENEQATARTPGFGAVGLFAGLAAAIVIFRKRR